MRKLSVRMIALTLALLLPALSALADAPGFAREDYPTVDGSTATLPLSYALMRASTGVSQAEAEQSIRHGKTTQSVYNLVEGASDLLLVYQPAQEALDYAAEQGVDLEIQPIGRDALVFLVNDANPVPSLTHEQVLGIYTGAITNWGEVGGDDLAIIPYQRPDDSGSQVMMLRQVMRDTPIMQSPAEERPGSMELLVDEVAAYRNTAEAIGYSVYYYVKNMYAREGVRLMSIGGVAPENETIASGEYPYTQDFFAIIRADAPEDSPQRALYRWLATDEGCALIGQAGYVALN